MLKWFEPQGKASPRWVRKASLIACLGSIRPTLSLSRGCEGLGGARRAFSLGRIWVWLKIKQERLRRCYSVGPCFHLQGFHFGTSFLSHSHMCATNKINTKNSEGCIDRLDIARVRHGTRTWQHRGHLSQSMPSAAGGWVITIPNNNCMFCP